jgi:hypothetical protein
MFVLLFSLFLKGVLHVFTQTHEGGGAHGHCRGFDG